MAEPTGRGPGLNSAIVTRMTFRSLRARLLVVQGALVAGLVVATLAYVSVLADRAVGERIAADLLKSRETIAAAQAERFRRLELVAQLVASFPDLRALFATDAATIRDFLADFRQRHGREELLLALDAAGRVVARSDTFAPLTIADVEDIWIEPAWSGRSVIGSLMVDGRRYHGALAAAESGGTVFGYVLAADAVDDDWARTLRDASGKEIVILSPEGVLGSTVGMAGLPWRLPADVPQRTDTASDVTVRDEHYQFVVAEAADVGAIRVLSLQSRDLALAPYRRIQLGLLVLGIVAIGAGVAGSAVFARSLTSPIGQLVEATHQVAAGRYDVPLELSREDELGDLARSFNTMTAGLRERADMQKFVSQSTVQMIQSHEAKETRLGERRDMTLLFCDIRGFTAFAEGRAPEEAVRVLNRCLRLQADLVKRFKGDVDKFIGDAVFAHFTGPDMALDAIRCALEIQRAMNRAPDDDASLPALAVGVGIATGEVLVGSIGSDDRLDYTAIGPAVNLASRLCATAEAHEILISDETFSRVRDLVAAEAVPPLAVKGFSSPVRAYRMTVTQPA